MTEQSKYIPKGIHRVILMQQQMGPTISLLQKGHRNTLLCAKYKLMGLKKNEPVNPHTATLVVNFWVFLFALFGI